MDDVGALPPIGLAIVEPQPFGDAGQAVTRSPAHDGRRGVNVRNGPEFPDTSVRRVIDSKGALADGLDLFKFRNARLSKQATIKERLRDAKNDLSIHVVLDMFGGLIAAAHRPGIPETRQVRRQVFA